MKVSQRNRALPALRLGAARQLIREFVKSLPLVAAEVEFTNSQEWAAVIRSSNKFSRRNWGGRA